MKQIADKINFFFPIHFHPFHNAEFVYKDKCCFACMDQNWTYIDFEDYNTDYLVDYMIHIDLDSYYIADIEVGVADKDCTVHKGYDELVDMDYTAEEVVEYNTGVYSSLL